MKKIIKKILYIYYSFVYAVFCRKKYNILNEKETVERILKGNYSVSRYGDGEFKWIFGVKQNSFQVQSDDLSKENKYKELTKIMCSHTNYTIQNTIKSNQKKQYTKDYYHFFGFIL